MPVSKSAPALRAFAAGARLVGRHWAIVLYAGLSMGIASWVSWEAFRVQAVTFDARTDYWEHSATLHALIENPWHPQNPHVVSAAGSPRFGPQFLLAALIARAFHFDAMAAMSLVAACNAWLLVGSIGLFFTTYFRDERAALYGIIVMFGSWWHAWHFSNVYQLSVFFSVASYPSSTAIGLTLLGFWLAVHTLRTKRKPGVLLGLLVAWALCVFVIHQLTAVMSLSGLGLLAVTEPAVPLRRRLEVIGTLIVGVGVAHFWPYFSPWQVLAGGHSSAQHWVQDSVQQAVQLDVKTRLHLFYRQNGLLNSLGLALVTIPALPYFLIRRERWFVALGALSMLVPFAVNAYIELPLGHRFILLAILYLQIGVVWLLLLLTPGSPQALPIFRYRAAQVAGASIVFATLLIFGWHNLEAAQKELGKRRYLAGPPSPLVSDMREVARLAGPNAVLLATAPVSWPVPTFGPKVLVLLHENPLIEDADERQAAVSRFFKQSTPNDERLEILRRYHVSHVLLFRERDGGRALGRFLAERAEVHGVGHGFRLYTLGPIAEKP